MKFLKKTFFLGMPQVVDSGKQLEKGSYFLNAKLVCALKVH